MSELDKLTKYTLHAGTPVVVTTSNKEGRVCAYISEAHPRCWLKESDLQVAANHPDL